MSYMSELAVLRDEAALPGSYTVADLIEEAQNQLSMVDGWHTWAREVLEITGETAARNAEAIADRLEDYDPDR